MKKYVLSMALGLLAVGVASCSKSDDQESITPSGIQNLRADTQNKPGYIVLRWNTPGDETIRYIKVTYFDPLLQINEVRLASIYSDSLLIPDTRKKYGEYEFKVQTVSPSGGQSDLQTVKAVSEPAPRRIVYGDSKKLALTADHLSTNAQEPSEGPIANLVDGIVNGASNFFHSRWSGGAQTTDGNPKHWFQVNVGKQITFFKYESTARNGNNIPDNVDILGSNDGVTFELIQNLTKDKNGMLMSTAPYTSPVMGSDLKPYRHIRYLVNKTNSNSVFFSMAEFKLFEVEASIVDPEQ